MKNIAINGTNTACIIICCEYGRFWTVVNISILVFPITTNTVKPLTITRKNKKILVIVFINSPYYYSALNSFTKSRISITAIISGRITSSDIVCGKSFTYVAFCVTTEALDRIAGKRAKSTTAPTTLKIIPSSNVSNFIFSLPHICIIMKYINIYLRFKCFLICFSVFLLRNFFNFSVLSILTSISLYSFSK